VGFVNLSIDSTTASAKPAAAQSPLDQRAGQNLGLWRGNADSLSIDNDAIKTAIANLRQPTCLVDLAAASQQHDQPQIAVAKAGAITMNAAAAEPKQISQSHTSRNQDEVTHPVAAYAPAIRVRHLGDDSFCRDHQIDYPYMTGAMANGIASVELVEAAANAGVLGSYGAAGQTIETIAEAIDRLLQNLGDKTFAINLIHSPNEPAHEKAVVDLLIKSGVRLVEASAFLGMTMSGVRYRVAGIHRGPTGEIVVPNKIIAKVSRIEVATHWLSPPPAAMLDQLRNEGAITAEQAELASRIPVAQDLIAEADSGGHTDNRPALALVPTIIALRDRLQHEHNYDVHTMPLRVGAAGGIATPTSAAAAFAMGAAFIVTGTVNQACVESGSSDSVRRMLSQTQQADVIMAPAADMFEMGVKLQVLKRGTMFAMRAQKLYDLYRAYDSIESLPADVRSNIEKTIFRASLDEIWQGTKQYFGQYDPTQVAKAEQDPKHKMALIFRWYLGLSSRWANAGEPSRIMDYQIWCGPAMGAFNEWTAGSFLAQPENRTAATVAMNLLYGAGVVSRMNNLRSQGVALAADMTRVSPQTREQLRTLMD
jgi:trans-AT polyketide synthase, acyltransferase and oxidoreductase domains